MTYRATRYYMIDPSGERQVSRRDVASMLRRAKRERLQIHRVSYGGPPMAYVIEEVGRIVPTAYGRSPFPKTCRVEG